MAVIAVLLSGIISFIGFLTALLVFDFGLLAAFAIYMTSGIATGIVFIAAAIFPTRRPDPEGQTA